MNWWLCSIAFVRGIMIGSYSTRYESGGALSVRIVDYFVSPPTPKTSPTLQKDADSDADASEHVIRSIINITNIHTNSNQYQSGRQEGTATAETGAAASQGAGCCSDNKHQQNWNRWHKSMYYCVRACLFEAMIRASTESSDEYFHQWNIGLRVWYWCLALAMEIAVIWSMRRKEPNSRRTDYSQEHTHTHTNTNVNTHTHTHTNDVVRKLPVTESVDTSDDSFPEVTDADTASVSTTTTGMTTCSSVAAGLAVTPERARKWAVPQDCSTAHQRVEEPFFFAEPDRQRKLLGWWKKQHPRQQELDGEPRIIEFYPKQHHQQQQHQQQAWSAEHGKKACSNVSETIVTGKRLRLATSFLANKAKPFASESITIHKRKKRATKTQSRKRKRSPEAIAESILTGTSLRKSPMKFLENESRPGKRQRMTTPSVTPEILAAGTKLRITKQPTSPAVPRKRRRRRRRSPTVAELIAKSKTLKLAKKSPPTMMARNSPTPKPKSIQPKAAAPQSNPRRPTAVAATATKSAQLQLDRDNSGSDQDVPTQKETSPENTRATEATKFISDKRSFLWESKFKLLIDYKHQHGNTKVPQHSTEHKELAMWVKAQRQRYTQGKLPKERISRLEAIGFVWDLCLQEWMNKYDDLVRYKQVHGTTEVPYAWKGDPHLGRWVKNQRRKCNDPHRRALLDAIDFVWET